MNTRNNDRCSGVSFVEQFGRRRNGQNADQMGSLEPVPWCMNHEITMTESYRAFLESWAAELDSRSNRVRTLIGDRHWASDGLHKEFLIREFFGRYLPSPIRVGHGFIRSSTSDSICSPEIDVLITHPTMHPLFFDEGGLQIAPTKSVLAAIEVKTTLNSKELNQALVRISNIRSLIGKEQPSKDTWLGAIFYQSTRNRSIDSTMNLIESSVKKLCEKISYPGTNTERTIHRTFMPLPTCICLSRQFVAFFRTSQQPFGTCQVDIFESGELSFALAAIDLLSAVTIDYGPSALELATDHCDIQRVATRQIVVTENDSA